ncbi:type IV-A pilus assembly ATPase PilB [Vibrio fluminensis]|uniref:type IV-A pilus assembly ATPase PilB n=1 Tax=Vibrio fluminensis TaxID=2783614 RepID=UPI0032AF9B34
MKNPLIDLLLREGHIQTKQLIELDKVNPNSPCEWLVENNIINNKQLALIFARLFQLKLIEPSHYPFEPLCRELGLRSLITRYHALPIQLENNLLTLAVYDPSNEVIEKEFRFATGKETQLVLSNVESIKAAIHSLYGRAHAEHTSDFKEIDGLALKNMVELTEEETQDTRQIDGDEAPVSRYIHQVLLDAISKGASDIHFEPYEDQFRIRIRCDGILIEAHQPPVQLGRRLTSRVKILALLDITEKRLPQDGRAKLKLTNNQNINIRISTLPTLWGEKIVLRILGNHTNQLSIEQLGLDPEQQQLYIDALNHPQGLILITGPTGSGKTLSLYSGLNRINTSLVNIATAEDPVEINLPGINQVQIKPQIGFDFACALRSFLRQDPDVIMVGEIRDFETADIAVKAAQTGHLVLSTLHTNSATETLTRLQNMGIKAYNIAASLTLVIAQRLVRRLCPMCKQSYQPTTEECIQYQVTTTTILYRASPVGCHHCNQGYMGRIGLFEVMNVDSSIRQLILEQACTATLQSQANMQGMTTLAQSGRNKLIRGETTIAELERHLDWGK